MNFYFIFLDFTNRFRFFVEISPLLVTYEKSQKCHRCVSREILKMTTHQPSVLPHATLPTGTCPKDSVGSIGISSSILWVFEEMYCRATARKLLPGHAYGHVCTLWTLTGEYWHISRLWAVLWFLKSMIENILFYLSASCVLQRRLIHLGVCSVL